MVMRVFLDTTPLIYLIEGKASVATYVARQIESWLRLSAVLGTSTLTLTELLVQPKRDRNEKLVRKYHTLLGDILSDRPIPLSEDSAEKQQNCGHLLDCEHPMSSK